MSCTKATSLATSGWTWSWTMCSYSEVKSTVELHKAANRQLYNYLRATSLEVGLLLHFGPEPKVYRSYHAKTLIDPANPWHPEESEPPFV